MGTLIFDIETIAEPWESFDEVTKKSLSHWIPRTDKGKKETELELEKVKEQLAFSPFTGQIVALGMYDVERHLGAVYYVGEEKDEVVEVFGDLRKVGVSILTLGQYLRPSNDHAVMARYYHPDEFKELKRIAMGLGFVHVEAGPLVRSSYHAHEQADAAQAAMKR